MFRWVRLTTLSVCFLWVGLSFAKTEESYVAAFKPPIGILAALPQELDLFRDSIEDRFQIHRGDQLLWGGHIQGQRVVATLSGIGKVNAALTSQRLVSEFGVKAIIFIGPGGAINEDLQVGDIVIAREISQHDFGYLSDQFTPHVPGELPEIGIGAVKRSIYINLDKWPRPDQADSFLETFLSFSRTLIPSLHPVLLSGQTRAPLITLGRVATGDQFIAQESRRETLRLLGTDVVDMEGGSVAQVAARNQIPCLIIRSISDLASKEASEEYKKVLEILSYNNAFLVTQLLKSQRFSAYFEALERAGY